MCDYSLHQVASRPARTGDRLVSTRFPTTFTRGFAALDKCDVAVCLSPGTEVVFDRDVEVARAFPLLPKRRLRERVARFRQVNTHNQHTHHDALEFPSGELVLVTRLAAGQTATVLQLPMTAEREPADHAVRSMEHAAAGE